MKINEIREKLAVWRAKDKELEGAIGKLKVYYFGPSVQLEPTGQDMESASSEGGSGDNDSVVEDLSQLEWFGTTADEQEFPDTLDEEAGVEGAGEEDGEEHQPSSSEVAEQRNVRLRPAKQSYLKRVPTYEAEVVQSFDIHHLQDKLARLEHVKASRKKTLNINVIMDYIEKVTLPIAISTRYKQHNNLLS